MLPPPHREKATDIFFQLFPRLILKNLDLRLSLGNNIFFVRGGVIKTQSCKAKARRLQQHVAKRIAETFGLPECDVKSLPMGSQGADVWLSAEAQRKFPFAIECKNVEKLNVHKAFDQAKAHALKTQDLKPILIHSKNRGETLATMRLDDLLLILKNLPSSHG